ncbi:hypothetical protein RB195_020705 [Necator americanus]|uniref:Uncharacterized protein n=1 Tax=Necator americanus TaxID=51031 RepID=A0ABR1CK25_NECAM
MDGRDQRKATLNHSYHKDTDDEDDEHDHTNGERTSNAWNVRYDDYAHMMYAYTSYTHTDIGCVADSCVSAQP